LDVNVFLSLLTLLLLIIANAPSTYRGTSRKYIDILSLSMSIFEYIKKQKGPNIADSCTLSEILGPLYGVNQRFSRYSPPLAE